jgi:hypothetical protein
MRLTAARAATLIYAAALVSCEALQGLTDNEFAVVALLQTPELIDPSDPARKIPAKTWIEAFFGHAKVTDPSQPQNPEKNTITFIGDAQLKVTFTPPGGQAVQIDIPHKGDPLGRYSIDSEAADKLAFHAGVKYTFEFQYSGSIHRAAVIPPPPVKIKEFNEPNPRIRGNPLSSDFTITREGRDLAVWGVIPIKEGGAGLKKTNIPQDANGFLKLIFDDSDFTTEAFVIPGSDTFDEAGPYGIILGNMAIGEGFAKLAPISGLIAASADFGIVWVTQPVSYGGAVQPLWTSKCISCHDESDPAGGLNLKQGSSHAALVGINSTAFPALKRVKADDIYNSYILHKLVGTAPPVEGATATGNVHPTPTTNDIPLSIEQMKTVVHWVMQGAPAN